VRRSSLRGNEHDLGIPALTDAALFSGAAFYVSFVELPARSVLDDRAQFAAWTASNVRRTAMQASLGMLGFVLGGLAWHATADLRWVVGGLILLAILPFKLLIIMPTDKVLMVMSPSEAGPASRTLLDRWGRLHAVRTALGVTSTAVFAWTAIT
jgi:hypothetical protein